MAPGYDAKYGFAVPTFQTAIMSMLFAPMKRLESPDGQVCELVVSIFRDAHAVSPFPTSAKNKISRQTGVGAGHEHS